MKSAFWLFVGLFLGLGLSYVAYLRADHGPPVNFANQAEVEQMRQAGDRLAQRQQPAKDNQKKELKSSFGRYMMDLLEGVTGGSEEERRLVEQTIRDNDELLHEVLEEDLQAKIRSANNSNSRTRRNMLQQPRNFVERPDAAATKKSVEPKTASDIDPNDAI